MQLEVIEPKIVHSRRMDNIDFLRAIAIISVLFYHYTTRFSPDFYRASYMPFEFHGGQHGVDLFFIVSGYCIFMTLERSKDFATFWGKRFARIQPAYVAGILITSLLVFIFPLGGREPTLTAAVGNIFWLNIVPGFPMIDGAYWSLVVEVKFYFWISLLYLIGGRPLLLPLWAGFAVLGLLTAQIGQFPIPGAHAMAAVSKYIFIAPYAPAFLTGLLTYQMREMPLSRTLFYAVISLALTAVSPRFADAPLIGIAIVCIAVVVLRSSWIRIPYPITYIGLISYSLYIVHQNVGYIVIRELYPVLPDVRLRIIAATVFVIILAAGLHHSVELRWSKSLATRLSAIIDWSGRALPRRLKRPHIDEDKISRDW
jgi:peptidoglycan/LPS O-acetylase OafA/YrhL